MAHPEDTLTLELRLSESLMCIFREVGPGVAESAEVTVPVGTRVREILVNQGINPLLVPMVLFRESGGAGNRQLGMNDSLDASGTLTLYGPLAGG